MKYCSWGVKQISFGDGCGSAKEEGIWQGSFTLLVTRQGHDYNNDEGDELYVKFRVKWGR